jgi:hypothetical protein
MAKDWKRHCDKNDVKFSDDVSILAMFMGGKFFFYMWKIGVFDWDTMNEIFQISSGEMKSQNNQLNLIKIIDKGTVKRRT